MLHFNRLQKCDDKNMTGRFGIISRIENETLVISVSIRDLFFSMCWGSVYQSQDMNQDSLLSHDTVQLCIYIVLCVFKLAGWG